jgi:tripartite-type tricarboxylate transporter receptor subunit TctC
MWARAGVPAAVVRKLNSEITAFGRSPGARAQLDRLGITGGAMQPEEFAKFVRAQMAVFRTIATEAQIQPQ